MKPLKQNEFYRRIITALSEAENVSPRELPPLGSVIDLEALHEFLRSSNGTAKATFQYLGWRVTVNADGRILLSERNSDQHRYVARCNTCSEEKRDVNLETAQDFFVMHAEHAVEINRSEWGASKREDTMK